MNGDELKVPSQRADQRHDERTDGVDGTADDTTADDRARADRTGDSTYDSTYDDTGHASPGDRDVTPDHTVDDTADHTGDHTADRTGDPTADHTGIHTGVHTVDGTDRTADDGADDGHQRLDPDHDGRDEPGDAPYRDPYTRTDEDMLVMSDAATRPAPVPEGAGVTDEVAQSAPPVDETPAHGGAHTAPLFDQNPDEVQSRWRDVQASFVDDPGEAVQRADGLVEEIVEALTSSLTTRTSELRERWKGADGGDTEQLRLALREYRGVLERLLALTGQGTTGTGTDRTGTDRTGNEVT